ncbi:glutamate--cysteine ligase catalytic subunit-like [Oculina patagonica]
MGLLSLGTPLTWSETKQYADHVRKHGILQLIHIYHKQKDRENDCLKWGDEVEYTLIKFDHENKKVYCNLKAKEILDALQAEELNNSSDNVTALRPEYASYMVEGSPGQPLGGCMRYFNMIEANMRLRREEIQKNLTAAGETVQTIVAFPRLGCPNFTYPNVCPTPKEGLSCSLFFPDQAVYQEHSRFSSMTRNIKERRGSKVVINVPIFRDMNTPSPFIETFTDVDEESIKAALPDHIYMDSVGCGLGMSCLQATFQACNINEARFLYDQLAAISPIVMALSAGTPIIRGYLTDTDCRWSVISAAMDDRTPEERGLEPLKENRFVIPKSRYDSISTYLSPEGNMYNDIDLVYDKEICQQLMDAGIDEQLARHFAHLFIRDPVTSLFREDIYEDDEQNSTHFENIQSSNWQTMRFKPPPLNSSIGWRVEFRSTDLQLTDFENAAYVTFIVLLSRVILSLDINLLIPLSKVDVNMVNAQKRDAVRKEMFYFRKNLKNSFIVTGSNSDCDDELELMSIDTIINGKDGQFPGLIPLIQSYLGNVDIDIDTLCTISQYLELISRRASGELLTTAQWIRLFVETHPDYKKDSVVGEKICYDLLNTFDRVGRGEIGAPKLFGNPMSKTSDILLKNFQ